MAARTPGADPQAGGDMPAPGVWSTLTVGEELTRAADPSLRSRPFVPTEHLDGVRFTLLRRVFWLLAGVLGAGVAMLVTTRWTQLTADDVSDFVSMIFGAVMTLAGAAIGFHFGGADRHG